MSTSSIDDYWGIGPTVPDESQGTRDTEEYASATPSFVNPEPEEVAHSLPTSASGHIIPAAQKSPASGAVPAIPKGTPRSKGTSYSIEPGSTVIPSASHSASSQRAKQPGSRTDGQIPPDSSFSDIRMVVREAFQDNMSESSQEPKRIRSILKNRDPYSTEILRSESKNRVGFKRHLVCYSDNTIAPWSVFKFIVHSAVGACPFWHSGWFETSWNTQPVLELPIPSYSSKETICFLLMFVFAAVVPLGTIHIPIPAASSLSILEHPGFSLGMMLLLGYASGIYCVFYFEQFFGNLLPRRVLYMTLTGPLGSMYHVTLSLLLGMMVPYGPDVVILMEVLTSMVVFALALPKHIRNRAGFCCRLASGSFVLGVSLTSIRLLGLMEAAKTRGPQVAYLLVLMLPVIFTRLTTDIQEVMPYASSAFSLITQSLLTWIFSSVTYSLILHLAVAVEYYKLFATYYIMDMISLCGVGPIWSVWTGKGFLTTSRFSNTIFGWAQNPIKPKPVLLKNFTRIMAAIISPLLLTMLNYSSNQTAFKSVTEKTFGSSQMQQMWLAMFVEIVTALCWMVFVYRLMKRRCEKDAFNDVIISTSKYLCYILIGGAVVSMQSILLSALPANGGFLD